MRDTLLTTEEILSILSGTPAQIASLTAGFTAAQLVAPPEPGEWSARHILAHLRACSDVWGRYCRQIISGDHPQFRAVHPRAWIRQTDYLSLEFLPSLQAYTDQRTDLLALLTPLATAGWSRTALVTGAGKPREWSVFEYARRLAEHERIHLGQFEQIADILRL